MNIQQTRSPQMDFRTRGLYFDELKEGDKLTTYQRTVSETDIVNFVNMVGLTEELFASVDYVEKKSMFGKRIAPGALTFGLAEGLTIQLGWLRETAMAFLGLEGLRIPAPVFVNDTIHVEIEIVGVRATKKGDRGVVTAFHTVKNQRGETVMNYTVSRMVKGSQGA
jgi:acyl dehydratase